jgi:uncharacterized protein (DUF433 family)
MDDMQITLKPGKRSGQPCIRGLRITVWDVLTWLAAGKSQKEILADYPELELLLLDENLSRRKIADLFPDTVHVSSVDLLQASDVEVWEHAKLFALCMVTANADFYGLSMKASLGLLGYAQDGSSAQ